MTTQKASELFGIDRSVISKLCKNNFIIGAHKDSSNKWVIPDETKVILDKNAIVDILFQILKVKNKKETPISFEYMNSIEKLNECLNYLFAKGYVSFYDKNKTELLDMLDSTILSDKGLDFVLNNRLKKGIKLVIHFNFNFKANIASPTIGINN